MAYYNFRKDLQDGNVAEQEVLRLIKTAFPQAYKVEGKEARWDIVIPNEENGETATAEVKNDLMAKQTGNLAIELYKQSGEVSGLLVSEADYWFQKVGNELFVCPRKKLREYYEANAFREVFGGDRRSTKMALVPIRDIEKQDWLIKIKVNVKE